MGIGVFGLDEISPFVFAALEGAELVVVVAAGALVADALDDAVVVVAVAVIVVDAVASAVVAVSVVADDIVDLV